MTFRMSLSALVVVTSCLVPQHVLAGSQVLKLDQAAISTELSYRPDDAMLNFLSGLAYEQYSSASTERRELARVAYLMTLRQDPDFWRASYQLGLMSLEDRDPFTAQAYLMASAMSAPNEVRVLRALARASYCSGDLAVASLALAKADKMKPPETEDDLVTSILVAGVSQDGLSLDQALARLRPELREAVASRLASRRLPPSDQIQPSTINEVANNLNPKMAVVDVVVIRRNEDNSKRKGINLLDSLSLQLGSNLINRTSNRVNNFIDPSLSSRSISNDSNFQLTIPTVIYSINLANARGSYSRIEARPTLLAYDGIESKIFDGGTLTFATDGQLSSSSETREVGLSLAVKPKFSSNDSANLSVTVSLENFIPGAPVGTFRQAIQTQKSTTTVSADVRFGQTMLISGGSSSTSTSDNSSTPGLGQIPLLGQLFSTRSRTRMNNELLILLSLRSVPGSIPNERGGDQRRRDFDLRQRLFPSASQDGQLEIEPRQVFYRVSNPANERTADYLSPALSKDSLKRFSDLR